MGFFKRAFLLAGMGLAYCSFAFAEQDTVYSRMGIRSVKNITDERGGSATLLFMDQFEFILDNPDSVNLIPARTFLYLNGFRLQENSALAADRNRVVFGLYETDTLNSILKPYINSWGIHSVNVRLSIGDADGNHIHIRAPNVTLNFDPNYTYRSWVGRVVILLVIISFFSLAKKNYFLKAVNSRTYSLSRAQLGWWTMIVICSYIALWSDSGVLVPLTSDTLILLSISAGTTAAAQTIDKSRKSPAGANDSVAETSEITPPVGFFQSILSDDHGVNMHRFQIVVFSFFIGIFFVFEVITQFEMPDLDPGILGLMGISSVTYAGLKTNEARTPVQDTPAGNGNP